MNRKNNTETNFVVGLGVTIGRVYVAGKNKYLLMDVGRRS